MQSPYEIKKHLIYTFIHSTLVFNQRQYQYILGYDIVNIKYF